MKVYHRLTDGSWDEVNSQTELFKEDKLYEPGYVQVIYLKVVNEGDTPFEFFTSVNVNGYTLATNVFGQQYNLKDYLRFGVVSADTPEEMKNAVANRETAVEIADMPLHNYDTNTAILQPGGTKYFALVVRMPEDVGNSGNYRGTEMPKVDLGITVKADQLRN